MTQQRSNKVTIIGRIWLWLTRRPKEDAYSDLRRYADTLECICVRLTYEHPGVEVCLTNHERRILAVAKGSRDQDPTWEPGYGNKVFKLPVRRVK